MNDIEQQLNELEQRRIALKETIERSTEMLQAVDHQINGFKRRQDARLSIDERIDNSMVDQQATTISPISASDIQNAAVKKQLGTTSQETRLIPFDLSAGEVHVQRIAED